MVKYKVNLKFKEEGKSLNETIINVLKIELEKQIDMTFNNSKIQLPFKRNRYFQDGRSKY